MTDNDYREIGEAIGAVIGCIIGGLIIIAFFAAIIALPFILIAIITNQPSMF